MQGIEEIEGTIPAIAGNMVESYSVRMDDAQYKDEDLVYVDPRSRTVVGKVEWSNADRPKPLPMEEDPRVPPERGGAKLEDDDPKRRKRRKYYPWGTYRSMKRVYKIGDWKVAGEQHQILLDEAITKAMKEPYWD